MFQIKIFFNYFLFLYLNILLIFPVNTLHKNKIIPNNLFEKFISKQNIFPQQFTIKETNNYQQPSPGFITNCSEPICEGPLAPIYCSGPLISSAWYFGLQHQCPGTKLLFEPNEILKNFRKFVINK
uniref:Uncharacterized protein n=1 Tax=Meloidogyne incognita TaxID=6306 RepID=A0A914MQV7_MELIC